MFLSCRIDPARQKRAAHARTGYYPSKAPTGERAIWFRDSEGNLLAVGEFTYG